MFELGEGIRETMCDMDSIICYFISKFEREGVVEMTGFLSADLVA